MRHVLGQWLRDLARVLDPPPAMTIEQAQEAKTAALRAMLDHLHATSGLRCPACTVVSPVDRWLPKP